MFQDRIRRFLFRVYVVLWMRPVHAAKLLYWKLRRLVNLLSVRVRNDSGFYWGPFPGKKHGRQEFVGAICRTKIVIWKLEFTILSSGCVGEGAW